MKIAVLGGGMVGSLIATELSKNYEVTVFDNNKLDLKNVNTVTS
jgi:Trk K+ transport system NAD-binding subunit